MPSSSFPSMRKRCFHWVSAAESVIKNVAGPSCLIMANKSFDNAWKYGGEPLNVLKTLYPWSKWIRFLALSFLTSLAVSCRPAVLIFLSARFV